MKKRICKVVSPHDKMGNSDFHSRNAITLLAYGIVCVLVSRYSAALLFICAFGHLFIQQTFIATSHILSCFLCFRYSKEEI